MERDRTLHTELDELLSEDVSSVREREETAFDRLVEPFGESLVLFGAGNCGQKAAARLRQDGCEPLAFADSNPALWDEAIDGLKVLPPEEAAERYGATAAFVVTIWNPKHSFAQTRQQLRSLGCRRVVSVATLRWKYPRTFLPFFWAHLPSKTYEQASLVRSVLSLWSEEFSRREYLAQLRWRLLGDSDRLSAPVSQGSYFPDDLIELLPDESFVDCGAYNGVIIKQVMERHEAFRGRVLGLEPDPGNYDSLKEYAASLATDLRQRVLIFPYAVGAQRAKVRFDATGTMASTISESGSLEVDCVTLDEITRDYRFTPTYLKMDVEGAELDALAGARKLIEKAHPVLAVCLYHRYDDLWRIPMLIHAFSDRYCLFLRPREFEGWELVCYAIPENRLKHVA